MLQVRDMAELSNRLKPETTTITQMAGCYVNDGYEIETEFQENFSLIDESEFKKYLEIIKEIYSSKVGNQTIMLEFKESAKAAGGEKQLLAAVRETRLKNEDILHRLYDRIIKKYAARGCLILCFYDVYDVIKKTKDGARLDESEDVYESIAVAICPVKLSKPGIGYIQEEKRFAPRFRQRIVGKPESGFIWPAFEERTENRDAVIVYYKNPKKPHHELDAAVGCVSKKTAAEQLQGFFSMVHMAAELDSDVSDDWSMKLTEQLRAQSLLKEEYEEIRLTEELLKDMCSKCDIPWRKMEQCYKNTFQDEAPVIENLISDQIVSACERKHRKRRLKNIMKKAAIEINTLGGDSDLSRELEETEV